MKRMLASTAMVLALGLGTSVAFAQSEQAPAQPGGGGQTECQPGDPNCPAGGQAGAGAKVEGQAGADAGGQKIEGQAGAEGQAQAGTEQKKIEGQAGAEGQAGTSTEQKAEGGSGTSAGQPADCQPGDTSAKCQPGAEGQQQTGQGESGVTTEQKADRPEQPADDKAAGAPATDDASKAAEAPKTDEQKTGAIPDVNVTVEQKTEIKQIIQTEVKAEPVDIDIDIDVGVEVPRTVKVYPLPPRIVKLVPAYEGYVFFVLADGRIIILHPDTYEVVIIIA